MKDYKYTIEEVNEFIKKTGPFYNPKAEEIFKYFIEFKGGIFYPEKWNTYEPARTPFTPDALPLITEHLSYPSSEVLIRSNRKFWINFRNGAPGFFGEENKSIRPKLKRQDSFTIIGEVSPPK